MKIAAMTIMTMLTGVAAEPAQPQQKLTVYFRDNSVVPLGVENQALGSANQMFGAIGIRLTWRIGEPRRTLDEPCRTTEPGRGDKMTVPGSTASRPRSCAASAQPIFIELAAPTPANLMPEALAYALPYEGVHIRVFYDRIERRVDQSLTTQLLAHVLVHEITHVLQGIERHSDSGIMRAVWTGEDYVQMRVGPLPFAPEDVELIRLGLARRPR